MSAPLAIDAVLRKASPEPNTGCWLWTEGDNGRGYGRVCRGNRSHQAHRLFYEILVGPIPDGYELDHKCRITCCVNPSHMEPVVHRINVRRGAAGATCIKRQLAKTHCPRGHEYAGHNLIVAKNGSRHCRECARVADRRRGPAKRLKQKQQKAVVAHRESVPSGNGGGL